MFTNFAPNFHSQILFKTFVRNSCSWFLFKAFCKASHIYGSQGKGQNPQNCLLKMESFNNFYIDETHTALLFQHFFLHILFAPVSKIWFPTHAYNFLHNLSSWFCFTTFFTGNVVTKLSFNLFNVTHSLVEVYF